MAPPAFPAVGTMHRFIPNSFAFEMAMLSPRALKEPVGFSDSSFINNSFTPSSLASRPSFNKGVQPSPSVTMDETFETGNMGKYRHMDRLVVSILSLLNPNKNS